VPDNFDVLIANGTLVTADGRSRRDLGIRGGRIAAWLEPGEAARGVRTIDATGKHVIPGGVDPHVHFHGRHLSIFNKDDYDNGSVAAAFGGTTTFLNFVLPEPDETALQAVERVQERASSRAAIDYGFHVSLPANGSWSLDTLDQLVAAGIPSFKLFMTYRREGLFVGDGLLVDILARSARLGALTMVHAENADLIEHRTAALLAAGKVEPPFHAQSRPPFVEAEAVHRAAFFAEHAGAALYVVHISSSAAQLEVLAARQRGLPVYGETCTHYLALTDEVYTRPDALDFIVSPPIRGLDDQRALWEALTETGALCAVGSDDCAYDRTQRRQFGVRFDEVPNGAAGIEMRIPVLFGLGVATGRISLEQLVAIGSTNPARLFGLYPQKGSLDVGADADVVILDPERRWTVRAAELHMDVDHSMFEGVELRGAPVLTMSRGDVIIEDGKFTGSLGRGHFLPRTLDSSLLSGPGLPPTSPGQQTELQTAGSARDA
jgi:dihydropyrimidinase